MIASGVSGYDAQMTAKSTEQDKKAKTESPSSYANDEEKVHGKAIGEAAVWKELMSAIQRSDISLWSFLSQGKLISSSGYHYRWQSNSSDGEEQYITLLNKPDKARFLSKKLTEITGKESDFLAVSHHTGKTTGEENDDAYMARIYETFGKGPVDIVDRLE